MFLPYEKQYEVFLFLGSHFYFENLVSLSVSAHSSLVVTLIFYWEPLFLFYCSLPFCFCSARDQSWGLLQSAIKLHLQPRGFRDKVLVCRTGWLWPRESPVLPPEWQDYRPVLPHLALATFKRICFPPYKSLELVCKLLQNPLLGFYFYLFHFISLVFGIEPGIHIW